MAQRAALSLLLNTFVAFNAALLVGCTDKTPQFLSSSSEFELEVLEANPYPDAQFSLGYAFAHGFTRVDLNGSTYRQVSPGVILRTQQQKPLPAYKVVLDQRPRRWLPDFLQSLTSKGSLYVVERTHGTELAAFLLPRDGWPGDQAGAWLAKLLTPDPLGIQRREFDVSRSAQVELVTPAAVLQPAEVALKGPRLAGCPATVVHHSSHPDHGRGELRTSNWILVLPYGIREVHCLQQAILLFGAHRQEDLELIAIDESGTVFARGFVRNDTVNLGNRYHFTKIVTVDDSKEKLVIRQAHFVVQSPMVEPAQAAYEVNFIIPWSAIHLTR